jgi:hypothetical protein
MPHGTCPPQPWEDPQTYIIWASEELSSALELADMVGVSKLADTMREAADLLRSKLPEGG